MTTKTKITFEQFLALTSDERRVINWAILKEMKAIRKRYKAVKAALAIFREITKENNPKCH